MPRVQPLPGDWTVEEWRQLPEDGNRYEIIDGVLFVTPAPRLPHQRALRELYDWLAPGARGIGALMWSPAEIAFTPKRVVQPDLFVAPLVDRREPRVWSEISRLLVAIEVLSPSTAARDRTLKRRLYQEHADEYWIVDLDARLVERWRPGDARPEILDQVLMWEPAGSAAPLRLDLPAFFGSVLDG